MNNKSQCAGFTMIETIIAFAVMTAAIIGPVALVAFSFGRAQLSQNKLIATNLGQEGLELVRAIRENNVICDILSSPPPVAWNDNPAGGLKLGQGASNLYTVDANNAITQICGSVSFSTPRPLTDASCSSKALNLSVNNLYTYGPGTPTSFRRCITICVPSSSPPCNGAADPDVSNANDQMEIISKVFWTEQGRERSIQFQERLYNWR
jgi:Tfp pilus assembly protein PilV